MSTVIMKPATTGTAQPVTPETPKPPTTYVAPDATPLGGLEQVRAGRGYYYDGPHTTYLRF